MLNFSQFLEAKSFTYEVGIPKDYFPKELHPKGLVVSYLEIHKVKAANRTEAAKAIWALHGKRLLSQMLPHVKKLSLYVNEPSAGVGGILGRLMPIQVYNSTNKSDLGDTSEKR